MQLALGFGADTDLAIIRDQLGAVFGHSHPFVRRSPIGQLVKSLISSRTRDEVSLRAYDTLVGTFAGWPEIAVASRDDIQAILAEVTFPEPKAHNLQRSLRSVSAQFPDFDLAWLGGWQVGDALSWLERLPGVGRKVSASTLNFSTLAMPAFVVDTHILRVLGRYGFISHTARTTTAYEAVMAAAAGWSAIELAEFHIVLKRLGQLVCRADQAECRHCPLRPSCHTAGRVLRRVAGPRSQTVQATR